MNIGEDSTSGYTGKIDDEMAAGISMSVHNGFDNLQECYVSAAGPTRLFSATRYGKRYILKCLKKDFLYTPLYKQALIKEFEIGLQMDHPYICRTIDMEEIEGLGAVIVMEYIDGDTLLDIIKQKKLTTALARKTAAQMAEALTYLHSKQIVHRDLKPSNVMITHNGQNVKLIDFSLSDSDSFDILKQPAGSSGYIAPEQLLPGAKADTRADIYSYGMILKGMAEITGDKRLMRTAKVCTIRSIDERPATMSQALAHRSDTTTLLLTVILLACIAAILIAVIATTIHRRINTTEIQYNDSIYMSPDGNRIVDFEKIENRKEGREVRGER